MSEEKKEEITEEEGKVNQTIYNDNLTEPIVNKKVLKKYRLHWYQKVPYPIRALFIKYWFFGLVYFLFEMGLGSIPYFSQSTEIYAVPTLLLTFITGLACGVFNDFFVYNILEVIEDDPGERNPYIMYKSRKIYSMLINIVYGVVVVFVSIYLCGLIVIAMNPNTEGDTYYYFREPLTCGLMMFAIDYAFIFIKNLIVYIYKKYIKHIDNFSFWRQNEI